MSVFQKHAPQYAAAGLSVLPLKGKRPFMNEWSKWCDKPPEIKDLEEWCEKYPDSNIGLCLGSASGLIGIDLDSDDPKIRALCEGILPSTPYKKRGKKGVTWFYRFSGQRSRVLKLRNAQQVVDVLCSGKQTVLPPSIHPDTGLPYIWEGEPLGLGFNAHECHEDTIDQLERALLAFGSGGNANESKSPDSNDKDSQKGGRNETLGKYVYAHSTKGLETITKRIIKYDKRQHGENALFEDLTENMKGSTTWERAWHFVESHLRSGTKSEKGKHFDPYQEYKLFFDERLRSAKKDIVRNKLLQFDGRFWQSVFLELGALRSYAASEGLKAAVVTDSLERYEKEREKELLVNLEPWDKVDRVKELYKYIKFKGNSFEVFEDAFKEWGANIFRRLYRENEQNRCIILKGEQGLGKDSLVRNLLSGFGPYYAKFTNSRDERDLWDQVCVNLVVHIEEFDQTGTMSVSFLKDMITRDVTTNRMAYAHAAEAKKCIASFISSVNIDAPLRDETGNRRFAVFELESIDWAYPKDFGPQIMSQFLALFEADYRAKEETWGTINEGNSAFEMVNIEADLLNLWDYKVQQIMNGAEMGEGVKRSHLEFARVHTVVSEMIRVSGWTQKRIMTLLKTHGRSKKYNYGPRYFANQQMMHAVNDEK